MTRVKYRYNSMEYRKWLLPNIIVISLKIKYLIVKDGTSLKLPLDKLHSGSTLKFILILRIELNSVNR